MKLYVALGVAFLAAPGCTKKEARAPGRVVALETDVAGLSGLSRDEHGALWAPGERGDAVLRIDPETSAVTRYPVDAAPEGTDLEALVWVEGTRFVLGTETQEDGRTRDVILDGRLDGERFRTTPIGHLDYAHWGLTASDNHGIEGLCHVDGSLVFATELVEKRGGRRWAPLAIFDPKTQSWTAHRLALTSETGKLSALDCRLVDRRIEALAVERHFGVSRLIRFHVPQGREAMEIEPTVAADLSALIAPLPNFEGLSWMDDGSAVLVTDNRYGGAIREQGRLFFIPASAIR